MAIVIKAAANSTSGQQWSTAHDRQADQPGRWTTVPTNATPQDKIALQVQALLPALRQAIGQIDESRRDWLARWEQGAIHLAVAIAARVIRREVARSPDITLSLVHEALELAAGSADIQLRLHPDDVAALGPQVERLVAEMSQLGNVRIESDPQVTRGGCRVETRFGTIDQQLEVQLDRIERELFG